MKESEAIRATEEETEKIEDLSEKEEDEKEIMYKKRESLTSQIVSRLQLELSDLDELHMAVPSTDSYEVNFSYRSSLEISPSSKRSVFPRHLLIIFRMQIYTEKDMKKYEQNIVLYEPKEMYLVC